MELNFKRVIDLTKRYFIEHANSILKIVISVSCVILIITCLGNIGERMMNYDTMVVLFYIFMFVGGFWFSSSIYKEVHNPTVAYRFLTLPASNFEKFLYAWIITSPLIIVFSFIVINLVSWLALVLCSSFMNINYELLDLFEDFKFEKMALIYVIVQPVFILGALIFRKLHFFNTILWMNIIGFGLTIITLIFILIFFYPIKDFEFNESFWKIPGLVGFFEKRFVPGVQFLFWYITAPAFLVISYFRLKEIEIN